ncbi:MAG: DUF1292 domain-containing protein [Ruminococcaceae bacterium]|nr:DUF1292 domain-containing protein [Oscillospiraceae bacterium]
MSEEFGNDIIFFSDDDGNEYQMEVVDMLELDDAVYAALMPVEEPESEEDGNFVVLRVVEEENGDQYFESVDDEETLDIIAQEFIRRSEEYYNEEDELN